MHVLQYILHVMTLVSQALFYSIQQQDTIKLHHHLFLSYAILSLKLQKLEDIIIYTIIIYNIQYNEIQGI